jgi:Domain of unknown function (DUF4365)
MKYGRYNHQGYFGECFVRVLASAAGLIAGKQDVDVTGVDFTIDYPGKRGTTRYPKIEAQVKSWSNAAGTPDAWHYPMEVNQYNELAGPGFQVPRYLFLILVPADRTMYAEADVNMLRLRHSGYWVSLADRAPINPAKQQNVTVYVPRSNLLTVATLRALMSPIPVQRVAP